MSDRLDMLRELVARGEPSATVWCVLRYKAACDALLAGEQDEAAALLAAYARDELALWEAAGAPRCVVHDPSLGAVTLRVSARRFEEPLQVAHGALLSRDPALVGALGRWALDEASLRLTNISLYAAAMIDALLAVWHELSDAPLLIESARRLIPHDLDAARRWCDLLAQTARGEQPAPPDRLYDSAWADPQAEAYRAFWLLGEAAICALRATRPGAADDYARRRAARDLDPEALAARLAPRDGFLWVEDVRRARDAGCYALAARFEEDALARARGLDALVSMLSASLSQLSAEDRASAQRIIDGAPAALELAMAPAVARRAQAAELARYQAQPPEARELRSGARLALRQHSDAPERALAWLREHHPDLPRATLAAALGAEAPGWSMPWLAFIFDEMGEEAAHAHALRGHAASYHVATLAAGERWPLLWAALELALGEDIDQRHGLGRGARTFAVAAQLLASQREGAAARLRAAFEAQAPPLREALLTWLDQRVAPAPEHPAHLPAEALINQWQRELEPVVVKAPAGTPAPLRRRKRGG